MKHKLSNHSRKIYLRGSAYWEGGKYALRFRFSKEMLALTELFPISDKAVFLCNIDEQIQTNALYSWDLNLTFDNKRNKLGNHLFWKQVKRIVTTSPNDYEVRVIFEFPFKVADEDWQKIKNAVIDCLRTVTIKLDMILQI